jgi:hypothetical protein
MSARNPNPSPNKGNPPTTNPVQYPDIPRRTSDEFDDTADEILMLRSQMQALQNAQVKQALDAKQTKGALDSMGKLLQQLVACDDSRRRSRSWRDNSVRSNRRQPSPDLPDIDLPLPTTEKPPAQARDRDTPVSSYSQSSRYSKKLSDPSSLNKGQDLTFKSWRF